MVHRAPDRRADEAPFVVAGFNSSLGDNVMPIYEYKCDTCGHKLEVLWRNLGDVKPLYCPNCDTAGAMRRVLSPLGWHFTGVGVPLHNKDPFNPLPEGYTPGNIREI